MDKPSLATLWPVFEHLHAEKTLDADARAVFLCGFLRITANLPPIPVSAYPLTKIMPLKSVYSGLNQLVREKIAEKVKKANGWHCVFNYSHRVFNVKVEQTLEAYAPEQVSTFNLQQHWDHTYTEAMAHKATYKRDPKDLVRFRFVLRRMGGNRAMQAITEFVQRHKNTPAKITTLRFYCQYGKSTT